MDAAMALLVLTWHRSHLIAVAQFGCCEEARGLVLAELGPPHACRGLDELRHELLPQL